MTNQQILLRRLYNQHISCQTFTTSAEIVGHMGAVQAQDYAGAKWALGLRLQKSSDTSIDQALATGEIIRTHVLRPTWHFVVPADLRWMLDLSASRIVALAAGRYRQLKLDTAVFKKSNDILAKALENDRRLNRFDIAAILQQAGVETNEDRLVHLLMQAELDKVICSGPREGKQFTYALFDDRVPKGNTPTRNEALAQLVKRYYTSRGPATAHDFAWWSGLTLADTRAGIEVAKSDLQCMLIDGVPHWSGTSEFNVAAKSPGAYLLPAYDEFAVAYADRKAIIPAKYAEQARHVIFDPSIVVEGQVVGTWRKSITRKQTNIKLNLFGSLSVRHQAAVGAASKRLEKFLR
jgi:hypothetical protein